MSVVYSVVKRDVSTVAMLVARSADCLAVNSVALMGENLAAQMVEH